MTSPHTIARSAFIAGAAALAALPHAAFAAAGDPAVIRAGTIPADVSAVITYANDLGYFKDAGLDVEISLFQSGPVIAPAVIGGTLDVGAANIASIAAARERGLLLKFFAPASIATPTTMTDPVMVIGALDSGRVDAAIPSEPFTSQGLAANRVLGSVYASMPATILVFGFFATDTWLNAHPDLAVKFAGAIRKAAVWANAHPKESAVMLTKFTKLDPQVAASMGRAVYATSLEPAQLQPVLDNAVRYGMLDKPLDANELIWKPPAGMH